MSVLNRSVLQTNAVGVIYDNTDELIDAAQHQGLLLDILDSSANLLTDKLLFNLRDYTITRLYELGEACVYNDGGGDAIYRANKNTQGAFIPADWDSIASGGGGGGVTSVNGDSGPAVTLDTDDITEGVTNLYFEGSRVLLTDLAGFSATGGAITAADSVLTAFGKAQNQINGKINGAGTIGTLPVFSASDTLADSVFKQDNATLAFSVGDGSVLADNESVIIGKNTNTTSGTKGTQYILIGLDAGSGTANIGTNSINIGESNTAELLDCISFGTGNTNSSTSGIIIGANSSVTAGSYGVGIGSSVTSLNGGIAVGRSSEALSNDACAYGLNAAARSVGQTSIGNGAGNTAGTSGTHAICAGTNAGSTKNIGSSAIIMGLSAEGPESRQISMGQSAGNTTGTTGAETISIGFSNNSGATNYGIQNVSIGSLCDTESNYDVSIGSQAICRASQQISVGYRAGNTTGTHGSGSISMGLDANQGTANIGASSVCIGRQSETSADDSGTFGRSLIASAAGAWCIGNTFTNSTSNSVEFGWGSMAWRFGASSGVAPALPVYVDEAAAATGGLTTGEMYITTSTRALTIKA
jgi:hypothetical protein